MEIYAKNKILLLLSLLTAIFVILASAAGITDPSTYNRETLNWTTQAIGQDLANLFLAAPVLIISAFMAYRGSRGAYYVLAGAMLYLVYTYAIYCFALHFGPWFLVYCAIFGLSFYLFAYFVVMEFNQTDTGMFNLAKVPVKSAGIYLITLAVLFYMLWLKDILTSTLEDTIPQAIVETGLLSNPVHVMDLAVLLPGFVLAAVMLFKKRRFGLALTPAALTFCILMNAAIGGAVILLGMRGFPSEMGIAVLFGAFTVISLVLLIWFLRSLKKQK